MDNGKTLSILGFILGLISCVLNFWGLVGIAAVICCGIALSKPTANKTFAWIGMILGICNILYAAITLVLAAEWLL